MQTVFRIKANDLNTKFLLAMKALFKSSDELEIIVNAPAVSKKESRAQYWARIDKAIDDIENNRNLITFTAQEFEALTKGLSKK